MADTIACAAGCKRALLDMDAALAAGWEHLPIQNRWRCPDCGRELAEASQIGRPLCDGTNQGQA